MAQIGIDVSKAKLDVCWLRDVHTVKVKTRVFDNTPKGYREVMNWLLKQTGESVQALQVMLEATGIYHEGVAYALHEAGASVYVANPHQVSEFAKSLGRRSKSDKKDSVVLARFLASRTHRAWEPEPEAVRYLKAMLSRLQALDKDIEREHNRREKADIQQASEQVLVSIDTVIRALEEERRRLERHIDDHIDRHPDLKADRQRLASIPGVGRVLSVELLVALRCRAFTSAGQAAAFFGLVPLSHQSGSSVDKRPHLSKTGGARLRAKLYMAAVVAKQHNPDIRAQYEKLVARGKARKSALGAAMRKLVQIAYGLLKHQTDYEPQWAN